MKALGVGFGLAVVLATAGVAQNRGGFVNPQPFVVGSFGNAVFPGGTSAMPGITRTFGNAAFPSGAGFPRLVIPGAVTDPTFLFRPGAGGRLVDGRFGNGRSGGRVGSTVVVPYAVPYYGGFYDNPYVGDGPAIAPQQQQQPNITVVYPPLQPPVMGAPPNGEAFGPVPPDYSATQPAAAEPAPSESERYLIAFKDRTIYAAVAYWVEGDTLHYFTSGNTHNQASLSMIDKPLTERLNKELGVDMKLP